MARPEERRRYLRLTTPINVRFLVQGKDKILQTMSKDISALGIRVEIKEKLEPQTTLDMVLELPRAANPVHAIGKVIWIKRLTLEDNSSYDAGIEFTKIEEDNKNTFLRFLCDLIYSQSLTK